MAVPNIFANATVSIPLSQLDQNFNTPATIGNTSVYLGNTATSLGNVTINNIQVNNYTEGVVAIGNSGTSQTISLTNGTFQTVTLTGNCTFTMPSTVAGKSFVLVITQNATGNNTAAFTGVKWVGNSVPTITTTATTGCDIASFFSDGTNWYGSIAQNFA